jgi:hypothetical protein
MLPPMCERPMASKVPSTPLEVEFSVQSVRTSKYRYDDVQIFPRVELLGRLRIPPSHFLLQHNAGGIIGKWFQESA